MKCPVMVNHKVEGSRYTTVRQQCGHAAKLYEVWGDSYCVKQELCELHAIKARQEGFTLIELPEPAPSAPNSNPEAF